MARSLAHESFAGTANLREAAWALRVAAETRWLRFPSLAVTGGQATVAIVHALAAVLLLSARAAASSIAELTGTVWPRIRSAASRGLDSLGSTGRVLATRTLRGARATRGMVVTIAEATWAKASAAAAAMVQLAVVTGEMAVTGTARSSRATRKAVRRTAVVARSGASAAAVALGGSIVWAADRSALGLSRSARFAGMKLVWAAGVAMACLAAPAIIVGRAIVTSTQIATRAAIRFRRSIGIVLEQAAAVLRAIAVAPASALASVRADPARVLMQLSALLIFSMGTANIFFLRYENFGYYWYRPFLNTYSIGVAAFILSRFMAALCYRPPSFRGLEPTVSIIVTAFNEEDAILRTLECCREVDYPRAKLEVVVVDDGSTDGTSGELAQAEKVWPDLRVVRFEQNRGKREAMAAGARIASGDVLVYVDSDSFLRRDAVRQIVQGFADPSVAAVAGHTDVANREQNALTLMQDVRYYMAFRVLKAAESVFGTVTCCPGCFSAYRRDRVLPILDRWLEQRFLGVRATFGDDRSLTNLILRDYKVIYSSTAVATTIVPDRHGKFLRQQLRWKKSWLRECLIAATFMWKKHPFAAVSFYAQLVFPILAPILLLHAFVWMPLVAGEILSMVLYTYGVMLIGLIFSACYLFWRVDGNWFYGVYFTVYYMFVLTWQMPYAIATSRDNRWGTR